MATTRLAQVTKPTVTATTTHEVKLRPEVRRKLLTKLRMYAELDLEYKTLKNARKELTADLRKLRESTGEKTLELEGFKLTDVTGTTTKLDEKILRKLGVSAAIIEQAKVTRPKKPYEKISLPGVSDDDEGEE